LLTLKMGPNIL